MTPAQAVRLLNRQLTQHGQIVTLQRVSRTVPQVVEAAVTCRAMALPQGTGDQKNVLVGNISQLDMQLVLSPSEIVAAGWTSGAQGAADARIPVKGNRIVMQDRTRNVEAALPIYFGGQLIRIEVQVRG